MRQDSYAGLLIIVDGIVYPLFADLLAKGDLQNIRHYIYERALIEVENAFACHPSCTYENMQAIHTGRFPYDPGAIAYLRESDSLFDLLRRDNPSKGSCAKRDTVFKFVPRWSISIHNPWNDAADDKHPNLYSFASLHYLRGWRGSNRAAVGRYVRSLKNRRPLKFASVWFPSFDRFGHTIRSEKRLQAEYMRLDKLIGQMMRHLKSEGMLEETIITLLSDHSMEHVHTNVSPNVVCARAGFSPRGARNMGRDDSRVYAYGYGIGQIYLADDLPTEEMEKRAERLLEQPCVEHVIVKHPQEPDSRLVYSSNNAKSRISRSNGTYRMEILAGSRPFGYGPNLCKLLQEPHSATESLQWTYREEQPDAVVGVAESLWHPDSPDIRFLASPGYAFGAVRNSTHFGSFNANRYRNHGTLHRSQAQAIFLIAGNRDIRAKRNVSSARVIDWLPTFLELAGYDLPEALDGVSLLQEERSARLPGGCQHAG